VLVVGTVTERELGRLEAAAESDNAFLVDHFLMQSGTEEQVHSVKRLKGEARFRGEAHKIVLEAGGNNIGEQNPCLASLPWWHLDIFDVKHVGASSRVISWGIRLDAVVVDAEDALLRELSGVDLRHKLGLARLGRQAALDDGRSHVVASLCVVLHMGAVAKGELGRLVAAAERHDAAVRRLRVKRREK
jgi:hypothetical protein